MPGNWEVIISAKHRRAGEVWFFLDWKKAGRICSPMPQVPAVCLGHAGDPKAAFPPAEGLEYECNHPFFGHAVFLREHLQGRSSCHPAVLSMGSSWRQDPRMCPSCPAFPSLPKGRSYSALSANTANCLSVIEFLPHHFVQKPSVHSSHCLMEVSQPTLVFGGIDLVIALIDFEGYQ